MVDVWGGGGGGGGQKEETFYGPPHCTTPAAVKVNKNKKWAPLRAMKTFITKKIGHTT